MATGGLGLAAFEYDFGYQDFLHHTVDQLCVSNFLFSPPTRFGVRYRADIQGADDIRCFLDATLVNLVAEGGAIRNTLVASSDGARMLIRAGCHVLAMGAIENARLLLHAGVGNSSGFVGRCFADHTGVTIGTVLADIGNRYYRHSITHAGEQFGVLPHLCLTGEAQAEFGLANFGIVMNPYRGPNLGELGAGVKRHQAWFSGQGAQPFSAILRMENVPNRDSHITLAAAKDAYGVPRATLNWQLHPFDATGVGRLAELLGRLLGVAGARLRLLDFEGRFREGRVSSQAHHLGTTRMSADPADGVVNADLRCHDLDNLYVAGSSVFPSFGFANPTLTIVALSLRLGRHLANRLRGASA